MEEITAALNAVPNKPPKRKKSHGRDSKWYHFSSLLPAWTFEYHVKHLGKKPFDADDPRNYTKHFSYDLNDIDIESIVQSIPEYESREAILKELREAIEDKLRAIALIESVLAEVTKWDWEEVKEWGPNYCTTDGKTKIGAEIQP
jgi:hypothetical protein